MFQGAFTKEVARYISKIQTNETNLALRTPSVSSNPHVMSKHTARPIGEPTHSSELRLVYVYVVGGYKFTGRKLFSAPIMKPKSKIDGLSEGEKVKVFYNPVNPHESFLAHSYAWPSVFLALTGLGVVLIAFLLQL